MTHDEKILEILHASAENSFNFMPDYFLEACESPIERLFAFAVWSRGVWTGRADMCCPYQELNWVADGAAKIGGLFKIHCAPQVDVGPYRVDFLFARGRYKEPVSLIAAECDGHDFHEKTKDQVSRDKARDRELMARGIRVFRFSGSDIWRDAGGCVDQILSVLEKEAEECSQRDFRKQVEAAGSEDALLKSWGKKIRTNQDKAKAGLLSAIF